jgi:hypothetical protein
MDQPKKFHHEVLMCGGSGCCPEVTIHADGSIDLIDNDNGKDESIHLNPDQAKLLRDRLVEKL